MASTVQQSFNSNKQSIVKKIFTFITNSLFFIIFRILGGFPFYIIDKTLVKSYFWTIWSWYIFVVHSAAFLLFLVYWNVFIVGKVQKNYSMGDALMIIPLNCYVIGNLSIVATMVAKNGELCKIIKRLLYINLQDYKITSLLLLFLSISQVALECFIKRESRFMEILFVYLAVIAASLNYLLFILMANIAQLLNPINSLKLTNKEHLQQSKRVLQGVRHLLKNSHTYLKLPVFLILSSHFTFLINVAAFQSTGTQSLYILTISCSLYATMFVVDLPHVKVSFRALTF